MRFIGIDIGAERHMVAMVDESGAVLLRATSVTEDALATVGCWSCSVTPAIAWS
jgi:predicted NBD/HSP70 family sugar kinase